MEVTQGYCQLAKKSRYKVNVSGDGYFNYELHAVKYKRVIWVQVLSLFKLLEEGMWLSPPQQQLWLDFVFLG